MGSSGLAVNAWLDGLPRTRLGLGSRLVPTYRTLGVAGYYIGLATALAGGMSVGLSLLILCGVALVSGLSFFLWAWIRRAITGLEEIVLLEQVWFAYACVAALLWLLGEPLLPYLDAFSVSLCPFLCMGRVGCLLAGCCHGRPSRLGITYGEEWARDGSPPHMVGVRLFPVQGLEALGLTLLWASGFATLLLAGTGYATVWFLVGYAILRFGLEGLRGDPRPELFGFSEARWMCLLQFAFCVGWWEQQRGESFTSPTSVALWGALIAMLVVALVLRRAWDLRARLMATGHRAELSDLFRSVAVDPSFRAEPVSATTTRGVSVAVSRPPTAPSGWLHVSCSLPEPVRDLELLCELAGSAFPGLDPQSARYTAAGVLHGVAPAPGNGAAAAARAPRRACDVLYGSLLRRLQAPLDALDAPRASRVGEASGEALAFHTALRARNRSSVLPRATHELAD